MLTISPCYRDEQTTLVEYTDLGHVGGWRGAHQRYLGADGRVTARALRYVCCVPPYFFLFLCAQFYKLEGSLQILKSTIKTLSWFFRFGGANLSSQQRWDERKWELRVLSGSPQDRTSAAKAAHRGSALFLPGQPDTLYYPLPPRVEVEEVSRLFQFLPVETEIESKTSL